jgi:hypothetical protein
MGAMLLRATRPMCGGHANWFRSTRSHGLQKGKKLEPAHGWAAREVAALAPVKIFSFSSEQPNSSPSSMAVASMLRLARRRTRTSPTSSDRSGGHRPRRSPHSSRHVKRVRGRWTDRQVGVPRHCMIELRMAAPVRFSNNSGFQWGHVNAR